MAARSLVDRSISRGAPGDSVITGRGGTGTPKKNMKTAGLLDLSTDVLARVMRLAGQEARVRCLTACKALRAAVDTEAAWGRVVLRDPDGTAVDFVERTRCPVVLFVGAEPDDVEHFLHDLADRGRDDQLRDVRMEFASVARLPRGLLISAARHRGLRTLCVDVNECRDGAELVWPPWDMPHLETLCVREDTLKNTAVWFDGGLAGLPALRELVVDAEGSDVLRGLRRLPALRRLEYRHENEHETYEDADMDGLALDHVELDLAPQTDGGALFRQLRRCSVRELVLHLASDLLILNQDLPPGLETLVIDLDVDCSRVVVDFGCLLAAPALRRLAVLSTCPWLDPPDRGDHKVVFENVPRLCDWVRLVSGRLTLDFMPAVSVSVH